MPTQALIRFVTQRGEFAADIRDALTDDEVFRGVSEAIRTSYPQVIPNFLWFESVSREQINGHFGTKTFVFQTRTARYPGCLAGAHVHDAALW